MKTDVEYYIVARRTRGPRFGRDKERRMEVWERAVLDVFEAQPELRGQMLSEAVSLRLRHLRSVLEKAEVSTARECLEEVAVDLFNRCDEAAENRPFAEIDADRERASAECQQKIDEGFAKMRATTDRLLGKTQEPESASATVHPVETQGG